MAARELEDVDEDVIGDPAQEMHPGPVEIVADLLFHLSAESAGLVGFAAI